ncbi:uncharacterized protein LOC114357087 [Ostrinia furnacalis]|uniref:uncharacterized protein LOC114357087 n=1 Tax=Ostrinia furnacalis TaxID=93504 RepID=UPI0010389C58|nr:uncharacterized protein LOC114357087 [Ostrinia furnacalis]
MHRQLKSALMCHGDSWCNSLPVVLLGMRSALKEDLQTSAAELVYGEPLRLPGEFVSHAKTDRVEDIKSYVAQLRKYVADLKPCSPVRHGQPKTFVSQDLATTSHVFLRDDIPNRPALKCPYSGPHKVLKRGDKTISLDVGTRNVSVSLDRVKPAFIDVDPSAIASSTRVSGASPSSSPPSSPHSSQPAAIVPPLPITKAYTTRSGRRVRFKVPAVS